MTTCMPAATARRGRLAGPCEVPPQEAHAESRGDEGGAEGSPAPETFYGDSRVRRLHEAPPKFRALYRKAWAGESRKAAIRAMCLECVGYSPEEVRRCTAPACPLYEFRLRG